MLRPGKILASMAGAVALVAGIFGAAAGARADEIPEKYRATVNKALEYLAKSQAKDGHWGANDDQYPDRHRPADGRKHGQGGEVRQTSSQGGGLVDGQQPNC